MVIRKQFPRFLSPYCIALEKSVGAVVFRVKNGERQYLIIKYRNGHWEFPRGHVEDNETEIDTMRREIMEEVSVTELDIIPSFRESIRFFYTAQGRERRERQAQKNCIFVHKKATFYLVKVQAVHAVAISHEHTDFVWLPFPEAYEKLTFANARSVLKKAHQHGC
jgi:8-oxo-dGTP pyrophosphatase MutT (NUDIX family)